MRTNEFTKKHLNVLALSYVIACLLILLVQQASATSYVPLPDRKPFEEDTNKEKLLVKVSLPAPKPAQSLNEEPKINKVVIVPVPASKPAAEAEYEELETEEFPDDQTAAAAVEVEEENDTDDSSPDFFQRAVKFVRTEVLSLSSASNNVSPNDNTVTESITTEETAEDKAEKEEEIIAILRPIPASEAPHPAIKPISNSKTLSEKNAELYKQIFAYQAVAKWDKADTLIGELSDFRLRGHILFQRYMHPTSYTTSFDELNGWMNAYADLPDADRVYKLALAKAPKDFKGTVKEPQNTTYNTGLLDIFRDNSKYYRSPNKRTDAQKQDVAKLKSTIYGYIAKGQPTQALKTLDTSPTIKLLDNVEHDRLKARIANSYMLVGELKKAKPLALSAANRSGMKAPMAGWVGGLLAWRAQDYELAASLFAQTAQSPYSSSWTQAAGAYWVSRSHMRAGNIKDVSSWLQRAAQNPRTFYGMIATKALGWDHDFNWNVPALEDKHIDLLAEEKAGLRALALVAAGQQHLAEAELRHLNIRENAALGEALLAYSVQKELPSFALKIAEGTPRPQGGLYDAALYPLSPWAPKSEANVDKAIIHALIRQESRFNPVAESRSGATGLMQLMPATASYISGNSKYRTKEGQHSLKNPQINLEIGEKYVQNLLSQDVVDNELFSMVIAYNAGPGNLRKWKNELSDISDDPLLFVESIPMSETRAFVERVMAFYWIYRMRLDQPTPSLQAVAEGAWPKYVMMDNGDENTAEKSAKAEPQEPEEEQRYASYQQINP